MVQLLISDVLADYGTTIWSYRHGIEDMTIGFFHNQFYHTIHGKDQQEVIQKIRQMLDKTS